ncbi:hypothetical protein CYMTET_34263 [Cymbomonas tetramitiformis]|uniref:PAN2-PAN3 deadenylation complex catalytic subunit PAN2 N-terminal domain-containing protein n=1 Tax=Cymbomonas tetramitiformis TaxID=36881 RepID=A0AAE0KQ11_9CHLO|nr:hypothetical protein CYMTET_34263 [Cymbomonas tetramitiformis]
MLGEEYYELSSVNIFPPKAQASGRVVEPATLATFDLGEELVWTATEGGWLSAFLSPSMERYCCVRAHNQRVVDMRPLAGGGVLSASSDSVRVHGTGGLSLLSFSDESGDITCCELEQQFGAILGRASTKLTYFDLHRGVVAGFVDVGCSTSVMKSRGPLLVCGTQNGDVILRDHRTGLRAEHTLPACAGPVASLDVHSDLLVSCGWSERQGQMMYDNLVKVYDIRVGARALTHIPFQGPASLQFHPKFSSTLLVMSNSGVFILTDVQDGGLHAQTYTVTPSTMPGVELRMQAAVEAL